MCCGVQVSSSVKLVREGRCALHTRLACYKFLITYGLHMSVLNIACYWCAPPPPPPPRHPHVTCALAPQAWTSHNILLRMGTPLQAFLMVHCSLHSQWFVTSCIALSYCHHKHLPCTTAFGRHRVLSLNGQLVYIMLLRLHCQAAPQRLLLAPPQ